MVWSKAAGHTYTTQQDLVTWLMGTLLTRNGWAYNWTETINNGTDQYCAVSRTITTKSGAVLPFNLVYEFEYTSANDINVRSWDPAVDLDYTTWQGNGAGDSIWADTSYNPLQNVRDVTVWEDDDSDAFVAYMGNEVFAMQLDSTGWLDDRVNVSGQPNTRPYHGLQPIGEWGLEGMAIRAGAGSPSLYLSNAIVERLTGATGTDTSLYQDYAALTIGGGSDRATVHWEDPSGLMKMKAHEWINDWNRYEVVKIDAEYYITAGPLLLPVGTTEPAL